MSSKELLDKLELKKMAEDAVSKETFRMVTDFISMVFLDGATASLNFEKHGEEWKRRFRQAMILIGAALLTKQHVDMTHLEVPILSGKDTEGDTVRDTIEYAAIRIVFSILGEVGSKKEENQ